MPPTLSARRAFSLSALLLLALAAGAAWLYRGPLLSWYYIRGLAAADPADRDGWVERVVGLGAAAVPELVAWLSSPDPDACANVAAALAGLVRQWGPDDPRSVALADRLAEAFAGLGEPGKGEVLLWQAGALAGAKGSSPPPLARTATRLLQEATRQLQKPVRIRALALANVLVEHDPSADCRQACRGLIETELRDPDPGVRMQAVRLALHPSFRHQTDLLKHIVPLLQDPDGGIRRAAVLAVGPCKELLTEEDLLPLLHDPDEEVQRLCESALRGRGLQDAQILLGRLISDRSPQERLRIVEQLPGVEEVEPEAWLRRLSHDPAGAVRAAAIRLACARPDVNIRDRISEMSRTDPSPTVRQVAAYYLQAGAR